MTYRPDRMQFGIFMAPFHRVGENPTLALERDLELVDHLDRLGYDEAWFGEHHSAGWEIIADPCVMIAAAAQRTRTIKLGTGVVSLPYHHPLMVADRMVQLDHLSRGRVLFGVGPGALTSDAYMMGIEPSTQRARMNEALGVILRLFKGEVVTAESDWFTLRDARLQLLPYQRPHMPVYVASQVSPAGPTTSGTYGVGILSLPGGVTAVDQTWKWATEAADKAGQTMERANWRLTMPMYLAEDRDEAYNDIATGMRAWNKEYFEDTLGRPASDGDTGNSATAASAAGGLIGTPEDAIERIEALLERSGGFGGILCLAHEWAPTEKIYKSFELFARYVAPYFQGSLGSVQGSNSFVAEHRGTIFGPSANAITKAFTDAGQELPEAMRQMQEARARRDREKQQAAATESS